MIRLRDPDELYEEVAFVAYHFGWSHDAVLELPHWERERWCEEISRINERVGEGPDDRSHGRDDEGGIVLRNPIDSV